MLPTDFAVVVDAYSTGATLAAQISKRGLRLIHVRSAEFIPAFLEKSFRPELFVCQVIFGGSISGCLSAVESATGCRTPSFVVAGSETGVTLADHLASEWNLPGNVRTLSSARRDKFEMARRLEQCNVNAASSLLATDPEQILAWAQGLSSPWPVVLKPAASGGSDSVYFCHTDAEVRRSFAAIHGNVNRLGIRDDFVLAQSFLDGDQYIVNTVSLDGQHHVSDIWRDNRLAVNGAGNIYDYEELLSPDGAIPLTLAGFVRTALDALGVCHGPAHSEVMLTKDGPVLIETASRLQGAMLDSPIVEVIGYSQISLTADFLCDPSTFRHRIGSQYSVKRPLICVELISNVDGTIEDISGFDEITKLRSYRASLGIPKVGDRIQRTIDLLSAPGVVYLSHSDPRVVQADYDSIRLLERQSSIFRVTATTAEVA